MKISRKYWEGEIPHRHSKNERFALKYIKELVNEGFDIRELFDEEIKAFIPKRKLEELLKKRRFEKLQKSIEEKFLKNVKLLEEAKTKEEIIRLFPKLWKKKKKFTEHVNKRIAKGHISEENAEFHYVEAILDILANHDRVLIEKCRKSQVSYVFSKKDWIVVINENGKIETAFFLDIGLQNWLNDRILKGSEVEEDVYSRAVKEAFEKLRDRFKLL